MVCSFPRQSDSWVFDRLYRAGESSWSSSHRAAWLSGCGPPGPALVPFLPRQARVLPWPTARRPARSTTELQDADRRLDHGSAGRDHQPRDDRSRRLTRAQAARPSKGVRADRPRQHAKAPVAICGPGVCVFGTNPLDRLEAHCLLPECAMTLCCNGSRRQVWCRSPVCGVIRDSRVSIAEGADSAQQILRNGKGTT